MSGARSSLGFLETLFWCLQAAWLWIKACIVVAEIAVSDVYFEHKFLVKKKKN